MFTHIDLFSGIGGFALASQWAGFKTVVFCEIDEYCQEVLKARFGAIAYPAGNLRRTFGHEKRNPFDWSGNYWPILIPEIRDFDGTKWRGATLLTGGFPCQPFSSAGRKRGKADDRDVWPEMLRVISEARPTWVIAENVTHIAHMVLADCENDLEAEGYEAQSFDIPACACGLSTMERHIWIVAARRGELLERSGEKCLQREQGIFSCFRRKDYQGSERFPPIPDLPRPILYRSRKGILHWVDRHKALGNAIPPQVAYEIIKGIAEIERGK